MNVALLHAFPLDSRMWEPQCAALGEHDVTSPDLYGLGTTMDEWAAAVLAQIDGDLVAVGASMGGYCALAMARREPERIRALVLAGARPDADSPERRAGRADTIRLIREQGVAALWDAQRPKLFSEHAPVEAVERARTIALDQQPDDLVRAVEGMRDRPDSTDAVASLAAPVLFAVGEHDPFFAVDAAHGFADSAANGRVTVFAGAGHLPSLERPDEFNSVLASLLSPWT